MARPKKFDTSQITYRDGIHPAYLTPAIRQQRYLHDREFIGSSWMLAEGGFMFEPSFLEDDEWKLVYRNRNHMVIKNEVDGRERRSYDTGYKGYCILAFDLKPAIAYDYDEQREIFTANPKGGDFHIGEDPEGFFCQEWRTGVYLGAGMTFHRTPQGDINQMAIQGLLGPSIVQPLEKPEKPKTFSKYCQTCFDPIPSNFPRTAKFCSVECGMPDPALTARKRDMNRMKRNAAAGRAAFKRQIGTNYKCVECDKVFIKKTQGNHKLCSDECRAKHNAYKPRTRSRVCKSCGIVFNFSGMGNFMYCSDACRDRPDIVPRRYECVECHCEFETIIQGNNKYCTPECRAKHYTYKPRERTAVCRHCMVTFKFTGAGNRNFCSDRCKAGQGPKFPFPSCQ